ncbi:MAG: GspE/PulE family protein [Candidatus Buchananbacteria bacterium]
MTAQDQQILDQLIANKFLTAEAAEDLKKQTGRGKSGLDDLLLKNNLVNSEQLAEVKSKILNFGYIDLRGKQVNKAVLNLIPQEVAENYKMVAFDKVENNLSVGLVDPQNFKAVEAVEFLSQKSNLEAKFFVISPESFKAVFDQYQILAEEAKEALEGMSETVITGAAKSEDMEKMEAVIKSAPISKMVLVIIRHALAGRASDIHIEPTLKDSKVRYRIDGILRTSLILPKYTHAAIVARIKVLANLKLDETRKPQDGRIRLTIEGKEVDFRVSTLPLFEGEKVVLRILETGEQVPALATLGFNPIHIEMVEKAIKRPHGLTLLTGPTGSGKTSTLYTILTMLNQEGSNIVTLEDPIEYYINGVNQSQINPEIGYSFATGLRAILRQDPNIVMVGEIRDRETTELVVHASLTGHMILSTLHTNSAVGAIPRLIDLGAEPFLLSSVLNLVIAQRLARKICPDCIKETTIPAPLLARVKEQLTAIPEKYLTGINLKKLVFYKGEGCARCGGIGYQGRTAVVEIIIVDSEISELISGGFKNSSAFNQALKKQDYITLTQDCLVKALQGATTLDEVMRVAQL